MVIVAIRVSLPVPLRQAFDYQHDGVLLPGVRVRVPFGRRTLIGVVIEAPVTPAVGVALRAIVEVIDKEPLLTEESLALLRFVADYYHHPFGEVLFGALPSGLKQGGALRLPKAYHLTAQAQHHDARSFGRARRLRGLWDLFKDSGVVLEAEIKAQGPGTGALLKTLKAQNLVEECSLPPPSTRLGEGVALRSDQDAAYRAVAAAFGQFRAFLLFGVTGSGKTEVYLQLIADVVAKGQQALVLVPEIGLTPQLVARFAARLGDAVGVLHSSCTDNERVKVWSRAAAGDLAVVVGTRSAVFVPLKHLGLIVVDEEHDGSFKQQDGFRYHARDMAVLRARRAEVPIVLGSATPSLESYRHAQEGRYQLLRLPHRGWDRTLPTVHLVDLARIPSQGGLTAPLLAAIRERLARQEQTLLFLNRRGYAPVLLCPECRWHAPCDSCDARLTVHLAKKTLRCHHCGHERALPLICPRCQHPKLLRVGEGTQRIEEALRHQLPDARIARIDRDTVTSRFAFEELITKIRAHEIDVLVGTQMLAKGHDFEDLTLVGIINADQGLYGSDFRADEQLFAQIVQVAGRAGRAAKPGEVIIQTHHPDHPLWHPLARLDYEAFAEIALRDRRETGFPPYVYCALLRAESLRPDLPARFLESTKALGAGDPLIVLGSVLPATLSRRAGYYRAQLLITSPKRSALQAWLKGWVPRLSTQSTATGVRWSLDVDPHSLY